MLQVHKNIIVKGSKGKPILLDIYYKRTGKPKPIVIFSHGFKGFKDWGHFPLVAERFAGEGFVYVTFNFSYNGTTPEHPMDFADLEAFGNNNYSIEMDDLGLVLDYILDKQPYILAKELDKKQVVLLGHSRGGGISILKAAEDKRITKLITWAAVSQFGLLLPMNERERWREEGVIYTYNSRTKQYMPQYYQMLEDIEYNKARLDIPLLAKNVLIPWLIVHGTADSTCPVTMAEELHQSGKNSELFLVENGDHTFGGKHPWPEKELPTDTEKAVKASIGLLKRVY